MFIRISTVIILFSILALTSSWAAPQPVARSSFSIPARERIVIYVADG